MDDHSGSRINWWRWLGWLVTLLALYFVGRWLTSLDPLVWQNLRHLRLTWLIGSLLLFQVWFLLRFLAWEMIVKRHGSDAQRHVTLRIWTISELARYVPGNLWSFAAKFRGSVNSGATSNGALQALAIEAFTQISGAGLMALLLYNAAQLWWIAMLWVVIFPYIIPIGLSLLSRWKRWGVVPRVSVIESLGLLLWYGVVWLVFGLATAMVYRSFSGVPSVSFMWLIGVNVAAWFIGYISLITPMGLGVREVAFVKLTADIVPSALASLIAIISRLWFVISELVFLCLVLIWSSSQRKQKI